MSCVPFSHFLRAWGAKRGWRGESYATTGGAHGLQTGFECNMMQPRYLIVYANSRVVSTVYSVIYAS